MKTIKTISLMVLITMLFTNNIQAQPVYPAANADLSAATSITNVQNTGNYSIFFESSNFQVMCWDGDQPGIGWGKDNITEQPVSFLGSSLGTVEDPDVVLYSIGNYLYGFFIYLLNNNVYYEVREYDAGNWNTMVSPQQVTTSGNCSTPNVDIDDQNHLAAVWEENGSIKLATGSILSLNNNYTIHAASGSLSYLAPDVAVFRDNNQPNSNVKIDVTFIENNQSNLFWQIEFFDFFQPLLVNGLHYSLNINFNYIYGKPRIACPSDINTFNIYDYSAVLAEYTGSTYNLLVSTKYNNQLTPVQVVNSYPNATTSYCWEPAISYVNKDIFVAFKSDFMTSDYDILMKKLNYKGDIYSYNYYSTVNISTQGTQSVPSVSGRYSPGAKTFYTFFDQNFSEILYKSSLYSNINLRASKTLTDKMIYPNPAQDYINVVLEGNIQDIRIEIHDLTGRVFYSAKPEEALFHIDIKGFNAGIYLLNIISSSATITERFVIH